jgi:hypothetical protein
MSNEYKIWRSFKSDFSGLVKAKPDDLTDETCGALKAYDDAELAAIAGSGFNAIWVHGILNNIVNTEPLPELGKNHLAHKSALKELMARAARHGLKVFIYMQPPRAVNVDNSGFWDRHPDIHGQEEIVTNYSNPSEKIKVRCFCTSTAKVQQWLRNAARQVAEELPDLAGIIMITSSEFPAHCYCMRQKDDPRWKIECPRCGKRNPEDIVVDIISNIRDGIREVSGKMEIIAWNWSWTMWGIPAPCNEIIGRLPKDVILMADFERGGRKDFWQRPGWFVDEYSLAYPGPSELCLGVFDAARKRGMRFMSKLQLGTTHELASVVNLPLIDNIFKKASYHKHSDITGFMGCWNFGNQISTNTAAFNYFLSPSCPDDEADALESFASSYFPGCDAELMAGSWLQFTKAMDYYPFCIPFIYSGPLNYTLAYPEMWIPGKLNGKSAGHSWLLAERGDDLSAVYDHVSGGMKESEIFSLDEIIVRIDKLASAWAPALSDLASSLKGCSGSKAGNEIGNAAICGAVWKSTANTFKIYRLRLNWKDSLLPEFMKSVDDELKVLEKVLPYVENDTRQGYHAEAHGYMFNADGIKNKIKVLRKLRKI